MAAMRLVAQGPRAMPQAEVGVGAAPHPAPPQAAVPRLASVQVVPRPRATSRMAENPVKPQQPLAQAAKRWAGEAVSGITLRDD